MRATALKVLILALALGNLAWAADEDEPGRGVARVSVMNGDVSVRRGDSGDWVAAAINAPLVVNDQLLTGNGSSAELQFDWANMIRLSASTEIHLAELENQRYGIQLAGGLVTFRVLRDSDANVEISTPNVSVRPLGKGSYRIMVSEDGGSQITVRSGEAEIFTPQGSERLRSGKTMLARGSAADPEYQIVSAIGSDSWDRWNADRDAYLSRASSYQYVDSSIYGVEDLDSYGSWVDVAPYGTVWSPQVAAGWAPYSYGRWSWVDWYGWSWVSYDPWGWAPFHYGRWFYSQPHGWCWFPGDRHAHHYWSPGLVAFFGWGGWGGLNVGVGIGHVGWVPLAPYETYHRWYGRDYYRGNDNSVHIVNNTNIVNIYKNARITNAVTGVDASQFGRGRGNFTRVSADDMRRADLVRGQMPVVPGRESLRVSNRELPATPQPRAQANERFFSRRQPAQVERVPFEQQQRSAEQVARRTFGEPAAARRVESAPPSGAQNRSSDQGWRRLGDSAVRPETRSDTNAPRALEQPRRQQGGDASVRSVPEQSAVPRNDSGGWRQFQGTRDSGQPAAAPQSSAPRVAERDITIQRSEPMRSETPRYSAPAPRSEAPRMAPERSESAIRISPPIVRERETPRMESPRMFAPQGGGAVHEAPRSAGPSPGTPRGDSSGGGGRESGRAERSGGRTR